MNIWKTLKVFISSTFKDLELERDQLGKIFQEIQRHIFERRLHLMLYDLRWQERNDGDDVVKWCMEKLSKCEYFVAILGYRCGWRPPVDKNGKENTEKISITEMEIREACKRIKKEKRFLCC